MSVVLALTMIGAIRLFDLVWLTTKGGPGISTITPTVVLYERAFAQPDAGSAAAIGVVMSVVSLLTTCRFSATAPSPRPSTV
jgi:ABC-type sugar transport system permease subunit